jgi:uncharacterized RDD family membrane protein YckC
MSSDSRLTDAPPGYLSEYSKRRFTILAGMLGAVCFVAQLIVPVAVMFAVMMPMMVGQVLKTFDLDHAVPWQGELWLVERATHVSLRSAERPTTTYALAHVRLDDLSEAGSSIPIGAGALDSSSDLLAIGDRLWVVAADSVSYYEHGSLTRLNGGTRPPLASRSFAYGGRPAVVLLGTSPALATLRVEGQGADWVKEELPLGLPPEIGSLQGLQAVEAGGHLYLVVQACTKEPDRCTLSYRTLEGRTWAPLLEDSCSCGNWAPLVLGEKPAVAFVERSPDEVSRLVVVTLTAQGPQRKQVELQGGRLGFESPRPFALGDHVLVVSQRMPGSLRLTEVVGDRVARSVRRPGRFPFGPNMMLLMVIPQFLPVVLSLILALVLTVQMRRHRVPDYVLSGERRRFATLWQRALAQLVDLVPLGVGFAFPVAAMWRTFSDPESLIEKGALFPFWFFGLFAAAFFYALLVLLAYSYFEGRFGKTPGKWLLGIRVLGTDLQPCGFGRALLRNVLTFADGFFNFLVGALLVALTENWQRLGDLAARTIVLADQRAA